MRQTQSARFLCAFVFAPVFAAATAAYLAVFNQKHICWSGGVSVVLWAALYVELASLVILMVMVVTIYYLGRPNHSGSTSESDLAIDGGGGKNSPFVADRLVWDDLVTASDSENPNSEGVPADQSGSRNGSGPSGKSGSTQGALLMSACPGRCRGTKLRRSLKDDLAVAKEMGVDLVVTLMPEAQLVEAEVSGIKEATEAAGMEWDGSLAWRDKWLPSFTEITQVVEKADEILEELRVHKKTVLVHCFGGKGRTGLLVVAVLLAAGASLPEALVAIRSSRKGTIMNPLQLIYLQWVATHFFHRSVQKHKAGHVASGGAADMT